MVASLDLPAPLLDAADTLAQNQGLSRSELVAAALEAYLRHYQQAWITERLNEVYGGTDSSLDPVVAALQSASLPPDEW